MKVIVKKKGSIEIRYECLIQLHGKMTEQDYKAEAWKCAIEDGAVSQQESIEEYSFTIIDE